MRKIRTIIIALTVMLTSSVTFGQETERLRITEAQAIEVVQESLADSTTHNVIGLQPVLTERKKVIGFAEFVLWDIYGKKNIVKQKPYDVFLIDNYWFLSGTLPKGMKGGTFLIIIDSRDYRVVRLTHSK